MSETELVRIEIIMDMKKLTRLLKKLNEKGVSGVTVFQALGCGIQKGSFEYAAEENQEIQLLPQTLVMLICERSELDALIEWIKVELYTGHIGDGKIFISSVDNMIRIRTGEEGKAALGRAKIE